MEEAEYRKLAAVEERMWYFGALHALIDRQLTARLGQRPAELLDAGCGTGGLIYRSGQLHPDWHWTGVDVSPLAVELAQARWSRGAPSVAARTTPDRPGGGMHERLVGSPGAPTILEASLTALPFGAAAFDAVVTADVLYHISDDRAALRELRRVLRPGGLLVVNVPAHPWLWSYHDEAVAGLRRYRRADLRRQLLAAGFTSVQLTHWNTLLLPLIAARRKLLPPPAAGSDVHEFSRPAELLGRAATALERAWLRFAPLPLGSSLFAVAR